MLTYKEVKVILVVKALEENIRNNSEYFQYQKSKSNELFY